MNAAASLSLAVLAVLADGVARSPSAICAHAGGTPQELERALARLEAAGLPLRRDALLRVSLERPFIPLDAGSIEQGLEGLGIATRVEVEAIIDSTNAELLRRARSAPALAVPAELVILSAELQTAGRGRQGRAWSAQAGSSLAVSFGRALPLGLGGLAGLSLMCGLAVRDAVERSGVTLDLKWPNDLLWGGQKLGGILIEAHPLGRTQSWVVIGVGLNVAPDPARLAALSQPAQGTLPATDLTSAGADAPVDRNRLVAALADTLSMRIEQFTKHGFGPYIADWNNHHAYRDLPVEMLERGRVVQYGIARGVDEQGRLCLETASGAQALVAGDVSLRPGSRA